MKKKDAEDKIKKLRDKINYHNYKYYVENNPVISDYEYDQLLKKLEALEIEYPVILRPLFVHNSALWCCEEVV